MTNKTHKGKIKEYYLQLSINYREFLYDERPKAINLGGIIVGTLVAPIVLTFWILNYPIINKRLQ